MMEPPGSYCAYACLYITMCLIKIFTIATNTFEEQFRHIAGYYQPTNPISNPNPKPVPVPALVLTLTRP